MKAEPMTEHRDLPLAGACQVLRVLAPDWASTTGALQRFERGGPMDAWRAVGHPVPVSLGRAGLAWGRGLHGVPPPGAPAKGEGDGCAPAGVFAITALFGAGPPVAAYRLPYWPATADLKAIDDPASAHYNRIVDQSTLARRDWASCEEMWRDDERYTLGAVIAHNDAPVVPGGGSCIFLHVWAAGAPTAGCTAMALADMALLAGWFDPAARPVLVQLPAAEYACRQALWALPPA